MMIGFEIGNSTTWFHRGSELWESYQSTSDLTDRNTQSININVNIYI